MSSGGAMSGATVLTNAQASQLLQKLRSMQQQQGGGAAGIGQTQTIKIQAIQTNPHTGAKQIVAIPIQAATSQTVMGGTKVNVSPMKVIKFPSGLTSVGSAVSAGGTPIMVQASSVDSMMTSQSLGLHTGMSVSPAVRVVKIATSQSGSVVGGGVQSFTTVSQQQQQHKQHVQTIPVQTQQILTPPSSKAYVQQVSLSSGGVMSSGGGGGIFDSGSSSSAKRARQDIDFDAFGDVKRRKTEKGGKGLRHFSMKVCEKVQAKGTTSYNEVADELVAELTDPRCTSPTDQQYDQKNIRRRVYDALNVLMAMNIISKEKKEIRWLGLPTNSVQEANSLELDKAKRIDRIKAKTQQLQDLILQQIAFKNLVERNKEREKHDGCPAPNSAIQLPFIIVNTSKKTVIDCSISNDKMEYLFNFDDTFEIHDDMEVLKRMGLGFGLERGQVSAQDLAKARQMVPRALEQYVTQLAESGPAGSLAGMPEVTPPVVLARASPLIVTRGGGGAGGGVGDSDVDGTSDGHESDSDVDIN